MWPINIATAGVAWTVGLSVDHDHESYKSGFTNHDAIRDVDSGLPKELIDPHAKGQF